MEVEAKKLNISIENIIEATGLTKEEIKNLKNTWNLCKIIVK